MLAKKSGGSFEHFSHFSPQKYSRIFPRRKSQKSSRNLFPSFLPTLRIGSWYPIGLRFLVFHGEKELNIVVGLLQSAEQKVHAVQRRKIG